jgi:hypothetical protein
MSVPAPVFRERMPPVLASARIANALTAGAPKGWLFINAERSRKLNIHRYFHAGHIVRLNTLNATGAPAANISQRRSTCSLFAIRIVVDDLLRCWGSPIVTQSTMIPDSKKLLMKMTGTHRMDRPRRAVGSGADPRPLGFGLQTVQPVKPGIQNPHSVLTTPPWLRTTTTDLSDRSRTSRSGWWRGVWRR